MCLVVNANTGLSRMVSKELVPRCFLCGAELMWSSSSSYGENEDGTLNYYTCPDCGCEYEQYEPTEEEKADKPFWNN